MIKKIKNYFKVKNFLTEEEYSFYEIAKKHSIKSKEDKEILRMVNDYLNNKFENRNDYQINSYHNRFLFKCFEEKFGEVDPEKMLIF